MIRLTVCTVLACLAGMAQGIDPALPTFRVEARLVEVYASIFDKRGNPLPNLTRERFQVLDAGTPQPLAVFEGAGDALSCALLLDTTGSMADYLPALKTAVLHFVDDLREEEVHRQQEAGEGGGEAPQRRGGDPPVRFRSPCIARSGSAPRQEGTRGVYRRRRQLEHVKRGWGCPPGNSIRRADLCHRPGLRAQGRQAHEDSGGTGGRHRRPRLSTDQARQDRRGVFRNQP